VPAVTRIEPWVTPLALMGLIFFLSAQPDLTTGLGTWDLILRKLAHATEYGLLALLWWRAFAAAGMPAARAALLAACISIAYSASDEYHQTFVHGRHGAPLDVAIDALAAVGVSGYLARRR
jgi:VanZ family protein